MAKHKFDGKWKFYDVDDRTYPPKPPKQDGEMLLIIEDIGGNGDLAKGSKHKVEDDLSGKVTPKTITLTEKNGGLDVTYQGHLIEPDNASRMVLVGTWKNNNSIAAFKERGEFRNGQNDGTWVMTKP